MFFISKRLDRFKLSEYWVVGLFENPLLTARGNPCHAQSMPKRNSNSKLDVVQNAKRVFDQVIESSETSFSMSVVSQVMAQMGRKGGLIGGKRRLETLSDERRREIASEAAKARWAKTAKTRAKARRKKA
jgi:hypothetical protein